MVRCTKLSCHLNPKDPVSKSSLTALVAAALLLPTLSGAQTLQRSVAGQSSAGVQWQAQSMLVGVTSTATILGGGDPIYQPTYPTGGGVVALISTFTDGAYICSGTLMNDRQSILTAAHCVTGAGGLPSSTTAFFYGGPNGDTVVSSGAPATGVAASQYFVHPSYTGNVIDQNDVAVIRLAAAAPAFAPSFGLYTQDLTGKDFNVWGYGARSSGGGNVGDNLGTGRLRQGDNRYDFRLGDAVFGTGWATELVEPFARIEHSWLSDFDNGLAANDASCKTVGVVFGLAADPKWCDLGRGAREVGVAGGDSGGPGFIDGLVASVNSYGLTYGEPAYGDIDTDLNSSFGEFTGYVPVYLHAGFINAALVPEPGTYLMMALGLVGVGALARRRRVNITP